VTYKATADIWTATNGAGIVAAIFLISVAVRITRLFYPRWQRITAATISAFMIAGVAAQWIITWRTTEWQYNEIQAIRRVIFNENAMSTLKTPALEALREIRASPPGRTIGEVYRRVYPPGAASADSAIINETGPFLESVSDSAVQLTQEAWIVPGFDSAYANRDGRRGLAQISIRVTREGAFYDIQN
jgi:hypothetical protein